MRNWLLTFAACAVVCIMLMPDPASARPGWRGGPGIGPHTMAWRGGGWAVRSVGWGPGWGVRSVGWGWGGRWAWGPAVGYGYASYAPYATYGAVYPPVYYPGAYAYSGYCPPY
jgi:hypothetical protein